MPEHYGYAGKVLKIDLSNKSVSEYPWSGQDCAKNLGGKIMAAQILLEHLTGKETAFSEENWFVISTGPLTGTGAPGSGRFDIAALSPKDDLPAFSNCGGAFGVLLKKAGYDALILTGRCERKCWLEITQAQIVFHDAEGLWGTGTGQCQAKLTNLLGTNSFGRLCIGPAGENLVKFASVISDSHSTGRAGIGAVMGWKNLKAIVVSGKKEILLYDPEGVAKLNADWYALLKQQDQKKEGGGESAVCTGCPLHCSRHERENSGILNELGMDSIAALDALHWAEEQGISTKDLYEDIAHRRGNGDILAEGIHQGKGMGGKRRSGSYQTIAAAFGLGSERSEAERFCRYLTEAVSAAGQCMFTINGILRREHGDIELPVIQMINLVTGRRMDMDGLLEIGRRSLTLEEKLRTKFET